MIYLDYSATTPLDPTVLKAMQPFFSSTFANSASVHTPGQKALKAVDDTRHHIAKLLQITAHDITFTSGSTEANNLALFGILGKKKNIHIVTTQIEHSSILEPCHELEKRGVRVTYVKVNKEGLVKPADIMAAIKPHTRLVSVGYVNSEIGVIQPIKAIGRLIKKYNEKKYEDWLKKSPRHRGEKPIPILFHSDATQAPNFLDCSPRSLHLDMMSLSAHKLYGPKGVGLLYCNSSIELKPLLFGGHQERNIRSGTVNVPGVVGFGTALSVAYHNQKKLSKQITSLRQYFLTSLKKELPDIVINTPLDQSTPSHLNLSFPGLEGDIIQAMLDEKKIAISTGSACASGDITVSHVLKALGNSDSIARGGIRITLGKHTTKKELEMTVGVLNQVITTLRKRVFKST